MDEKIKKSLRYSLLDGIFASIMQGMTETFIIPYAIAMKASAAFIGLLSSVPNLVGSFIQTNSPVLVERLGSRKALINSAVFIHALMWIPIVAIPYIFNEHQVVYLMLFYTFSITFGLLSFPPWSSLMSDHVKEGDRGRIFGWRNMVFGLTNVTCMMVAGVMLNYANNIIHNRFLGFTAIFLTAFIARMISWVFLTKMFEPSLIIRDEHRFTMMDFMKRIWVTNFGRFVIFAASMNFAVYLVSPFFALYMLRDLGFSYLTYTIITMSATLTSLVMMKVWGSQADNIGNRKVLRLTSLFLPAIPLFWLFSHNVYYLISIQIFAGFFWAGFNLSVSNFIYDAVRPEKRTRCISYFNMVNGVAIFCGAATGGILMKILPNIGPYKIFTLLVISGLLRIFAASLCTLVKEVRKVKTVSNIELFYSMLGLKQDIFASNLRE